MLCKLGVTMQGQSCAAARINSDSRKAMNEFGDVALDLAVAQNCLKSLDEEQHSTQRVLRMLEGEEGVLKQHLQQLEVESAACNWFLQDARYVHEQIFLTDTNADKRELMKTRHAVAKQRKRWRCLVSDAVHTMNVLDGELAQQIKAIKSVTGEWKEMKAFVSKAAEELEQCRVRRVQAESGAEVASGSSSGQPADESNKMNASPIPRCSVICCGKKHLDEIPLLMDAEAELQLLETLPPLKLLMTLQGYSLAFTQLAKVICSLSEWVSSVSHTQLLDSPQAMGMLSMAGRDILQSDHVVVYRHMGEHYWAVAPTALSSNARDGKSSSTPGLLKVGRGMVGYAAMVGKDVRVADAKASPLYDARAEDITVSPVAHSAHPTAIVRAQQAAQEDGVVLVKGMRGLRGGAALYSQDDMSALRALANNAQQAIDHQEGMWNAQRKTALANFMVDVRRAMGSELQLQRAVDSTAVVLAEAADSDVGLVHLLRPDRRNPSFQTFSSLHGARRGVRPWQASLLMQCCTTKQAVICNDTSKDGRFVSPVDGSRTGVKIRNTLLVPWMSSTGSCMGVLQVQNRKCQPATHLHPYSKDSLYSDNDVTTLADVACMLETTRRHCESLLALRDRENPLAHVPFTEHMEDAHTKFQYMLKDALGILHARFLEVDHQNQQLIASGERSRSYYPLSAASIASTVVSTGKIRHLHNPVIAPDFNKHIDGGAGVGGVEDLLVVPVMEATCSPHAKRSLNAGTHMPDQRTATDTQTPVAHVIAICQVSSKRRGLLGANDIHLAGKLAAQISFMLQRVQQICKGKRVAAQLASVTCTMQQLSLAQQDPHRRQAVMNDVARNVLAAEMVQLAPLKAVRISEVWDCVPPNAKARALTDEIVKEVEVSQVLYEATRRCLSQQDAFFGTTIMPERLLGCPVWMQPGAMYAVLVVQRFSIEPYSEVEVQIVNSIAHRTGLLALRHAS